LSERDGQVFQASLLRCLDKPAFLEEFYEVFVAASDEIRQMFKDTDFTRQRRALSASLYSLAVAAQAGPRSPAWAEMNRLARLHKDLGVRADHYEVWLDCLMQTARRHDPQFTPEIEAAWRRSLRTGIDYMLARY
jgi:hemoglobin-like flavoprotein